MITLVTGTPGAGKTAWIVSELLKLKESAEKTGEVPRLVYVHAIPDLKLPHTPVYCRSDLCEYCSAWRSKGEQGLYVEDWKEWLPDGGLVIVDECQRVWRPRASGAAVPPSVAYLETHRHGGRDFWLISQGPHLFDSNVRRLVGRHVHLRSTWRGRKEHEWPECHENMASLGDSAERPYRLPKRVFGLYRSASLHTTLTHRKPLSFYVFCVLVVLGILTSGYAVHRIKSKVAPDTVSPSVASGPGGDALRAAPPGQIAGRAVAVDFKPRVDGRPETAPAYDGLLKVSSVPTPAACIDSRKGGCKCFTAQATPYEMPEAICREYVQGRVFNPYLKEHLPVSGVKASPGLAD